MANYPVSLDTITNPTSGNTLDNPSHSLQHSDANDILEALERKVGIGSSVAGSATSGHALVASTGGTTSWTTIGTAGISSGTAVNNSLLTANGSGGVSFTSPTGLVLLNTTSFSAVSSQSINDVFSSNYLQYLILIDWSGNTDGTGIGCKLRVSGTDATTNYNQQYHTIDGTSASGAARATAQSQWDLGISGTASRNFVNFVISSPFETRTTTGYATGVSSFNTIYQRNYYLNNTNATSYTGFTIFVTGTMTGSVSVYGYNK